MDGLAKFFYDSIKPAIEKLNDDIRKDVYVYTLSISYQYGDYRLPIISLGYNTNAQVATMQSKAASARDARWNYSFWLRNKLISIGEGKESVNLTNWIKKSGLHYTDSEEERDYNACLEKAEKITFNIVDALIAVVKQLKADGLQLPTIIHALEYFEESKAWNIAANGETAISEYIEWFDSDEF